MLRSAASLLLVSCVFLVLGCTRDLGYAEEDCLAEYNKEATEVTVTGDCNHLLCVVGPGNTHINCEETQEGKYFQNKPCDVTGWIASGSVDIAGAACDYTCTLNSSPNGAHVDCKPN